MAPPRAATAPAVMSDSSVRRGAAEPDPDQQRALEQEAQADAARG